MNEFTWKDEKINEMQEKAYQVCKRLFALYIKNYKKAMAGEGAFYGSIADDYRNQYQGACDVYEDVFEEEFMLNDEDRKKILGKIGYGSSANEESYIVMRE